MSVYCRLYERETTNQNDWLHHCRCLVLLRPLFLLSFPVTVPVTILITIIVVVVIATKIDAAFITLDGELHPETKLAQLLSKRNCKGGRP